MGPGIFSDLHPALGDLAQALEFFAALYVGTPLIASYGETSLSALQRRRENCAEALGAVEPRELVSADDALTDLRIAIDEPYARGGLRLLLFVAFIHVSLALVFTSCAHADVPAVAAFWLLLGLFALYLWLAAPALMTVMSKETTAVEKIKGLEAAVRQAAVRAH